MKIGNNSYQRTGRDIHRGDMKQATTVDHQPAIGANPDSRSKAMRWRFLGEFLKRRVGGHIDPAFSIIEVLPMLYDDFLCQLSMPGNREATTGKLAMGCR
ncbi:hypothetical protein AOQ71_20200 [Bradyrhizobium manausense]|uniref:Uncharacterized protein n=1 Tax=Bradyrhizobium manausense TaxID=989370 RepID=A0A0R3DJE5_9BRAD|nr:hypothetical protein AOQ71_20200 [Bradyrhizobium manausense]